MPGTEPNSSSPSTISKVRLSDFTYVDSIVLATDEVNLGSAAIEITAEAAMAKSGIAGGKTNKHKSTVKAHVSRIFDTLGVANRVAAAMLARDAAGT